MSVTQDPSVQDLMNYEALAQDALRGVAKAALKRAAAPDGLPGSHHFYITFKTDAAGVSGPNDLLSKYPDEMTIVLQHQYWDLAPGETFFSVTLQFGGQPKRLSVPYAAITRFYDPSVQFLLQFEAPPAAPQEAKAAPVAVPDAKPEAAQPSPQRQRSSLSTSSGRNERMSDVAASKPAAGASKEPSEEALTDEAILQRFLRTKNQPTGSQTLGFRLVAVSQAEKSVEVEFDAKAELLLNPMKQIQGGYLCAMLDECMSVACMVASGMTAVAPTLEMKTSFFRPGQPGKLKGIGKVVRWGRQVAFTEGELFDPEGRTLAKATGTAIPTPFNTYKT